METSVQIKKAFSTCEKMAQIRERLKDASALTSRYVWYEFQRTIVADCVWLHQMIAQQPTLVEASETSEVWKISVLVLSSNKPTP